MRGIESCKSRQGIVNYFRSIDFFFRNDFTPNKASNLLAVISVKMPALLTLGSTANALIKAK